MEHTTLVLETRGPDNTPVYTAYAVQKTFSSSGRCVVQLQGLESRSAVEVFVNAAVWIRRQDVEEEGEETVLVADLLGVAVQKPCGQCLGHVIAVHNFGAQDTLEIQPLCDEEDSFFFPFLDLYTVSFDKKEKVLVVNDLFFQDDLT